MVRFLAWNIDQAVREENHEKTKWDSRSKQVKELISAVSPDIAALIELRDLKTSTEHARQIPHEFSRV